MVVTTPAICLNAATSLGLGAVLQDFRDAFLPCHERKAHDLLVMVGVARRLITKARISRRSPFCIQYNTFYFIAISSGSSLNQRLNRKHYQRI